MDLLEKIEDIIEQENNIISVDDKKIKPEFTFDEKIFNRLANFVFNLDPDSLNDDQLQEVMGIIEDIETNFEEIKEQGNPRLANRSTVGKNNASKKWYRENKSRVKKKKKEFERSSKGRKKQKEKIEKQGKETRKSKYHTRIKSDRNDYEKREYGK